MAHRILGAQGDVAAGVGIAHAVGAVRFPLTGGLLAFGIWAALPALSDIQLPSRLVFPTALALLPAASTAGTTAVQPAIGSAQQSGRAVAVTLSLSDRDLTAAAQPYLPQTYAGVTVSSPSVRVTSGQLVLSASARSFLGTSALVARRRRTRAVDGSWSASTPRRLAGSRSPMRPARRSRSSSRRPSTRRRARLQVSAVSASAGVLTLSGTALPH